MAWNSEVLRGLDYRSKEYQDALRGVPPASWPAVDPPFEVSSRDPIPAGAPAKPKSVLDLMAAGMLSDWEVRVGYSRGLVRTRTVGVYQRKEFFGAWAGRHPLSEWRWFATYGRAVAAKAWTWETIGIWSVTGRTGLFPYASITDLKEFIAVRGSVLPAWFTAIGDRVKAQRDAPKAPRTTRKREGA